MAETVITDTRELVRTGLRPVYIFDEVTRGATRLHEKVGVTPRGDTDLKKLYLPDLDEQTIVEVRAAAGTAFYIPTPIKLLQEKDRSGRNAVAKLDASELAAGRQPDANPMFVTLVNTTEKDRLVRDENYRVLPTSVLLSR